MFPKLRFKKFDGDWTAVTLESLAEVERGKFSVRPRNDPRYFGGEMPFIQTGDVTGSDVYLKGYTQTLNDDGIRVSKVFPADTILITIAANIGDTTITQYPVACPDSVVAIQPKQDKVNTIFLKNVIDLQKDNLDSQATQNAQKNINLQVLKPLKLIVPSKEEQNKIASFLSAVDEKISQLTQKLELLSQYKQGMMQKLFSQQIRFKADDGSEFGEWEETLLSEFLTESLIKGLKGNEAKKLTVKLWGKGVVPKNEVFEGSENTQYYKRFVGQLIYGKLDFLNCAFGIIPTHLDGYETTIDAPSFDINKEKANPYFLLNRFLQKDFYKKNGEEADGSRKAKRINQSVFLAMQIDLPCLAEQTKIANFLSAIDQKIEVVAQQIEQAKQWKKGLLQQMFV